VVLFYVGHFLVGRVYRETPQSDLGKDVLQLNVHTTTRKPKRGFGLFIASLLVWFCSGLQALGVNHIPVRNTTDLQRLLDCMRVNKNWSNDKHISLQCDIEIPPSKCLSGSGEGYAFEGTFDGNGHTVTLNGSNMFGSIGENGGISRITIKGHGSLATENHGNVRDISSYATASYGIAGSNSGSITNCSVYGTISSAGIVGNNSGYLFNCSFSGEISGYSHVVAGIANSNSPSGVSRNCSVSAKFNPVTSSQYSKYSPTDLQPVNWNSGKIGN
jgi:hypothetical protein